MFCKIEKENRVTKNRVIKNKITQNRIIKFDLAVKNNQQNLKKGGHNV